MKFTVIATVLLSTFVVAQADKKSVIVEDADEIKTNPETKLAYCGIVNQCRNGHSDNSEYSEASSSSFLSLQSRLEKLETENIEYTGNLKTLNARLNGAKQQKRFADFSIIAENKPVFWLSGSYFDGLSESVSLYRTGEAPLTDVLGNAVTRVGNVAVAPVRGRMAYIFDKSNSIMSSASISSQFTMILVYRFEKPPVGREGRFCTSHTGNKLFGGWFTGAHKAYIEGWIHNSDIKTTDTVVLILTNNNGIKNIWTHDRQLVLNSNVGANIWGHVVIGRPQTFVDEAASVNVYEAVVFDKVLNAEQRNDVLTVLKRWYDFN